jgi:hypothetical protein
MPLSAIALEENCIRYRGTNQAAKKDPKDTLYGLEERGFVP